MYELHYVTFQKFPAEIMGSIMDGLWKHSMG